MNQVFTKYYIIYSNIYLDQFRSNRRRKVNLPNIIIHASAAEAEIRKKIGSKKKRIVLEEGAGICVLQGIGENRLKVVGGLSNT